MLHLEEALPKTVSTGLGAAIAPSATCWRAESDPGLPTRLDTDYRHFTWSTLLTTPHSFYLF